MPSRVSPLPPKKAVAQEVFETTSASKKTDVVASVKDMKSSVLREEIDRADVNVSRLHGEFFVRVLVYVPLALRYGTGYITVTSEEGTTTILEVDSKESPLQSIAQILRKDDLVEPGDASDMDSCRFFRNPKYKQSAFRCVPEMIPSGTTTPSK
ncbi:MAG: hypothetical protein NTW94_02180 [Legionellales bacterium]|nr:hypothetical protein [Legionellales bacterium]